MGTETSRDYARLISKIDTEGYAFWTPHPGGVIGDCGIVRPDGQFVKLFNVFAQGTGFECLPTAEQRPTHVPTALDLTGWPNPADEAERSVRNEDNINVWRAHESNDWSVEVEAPIPVGHLGFGFALSASKGIAAFLAPCGPKRRVETYLMDRVFPEYLKRNGKAIRDRYSNTYDIGTVYILEGTTHSASWCRALTRQKGRAIHGSVSVDPIPGVPAFRISGGNGQMVNHPWTIAAGPGNWPPDGRLHLIRARLTIRHWKRPKWLRDSSRHQVVAANNATSGPAGSSGSILSWGWRPGGRSTSSTEPASSAITAQRFRLVTSVTSRLFAMITSSSGADVYNSSDKRGDYAPNFVQMLLDTVLDAHPEYDSLVVNWRVLQAFWDSFENTSSYDKDLLAFDLEGFSDGEDRAAVVCKIALQTLDPLLAAISMPENTMLTDTAVGARWMTSGMLGSSPQSPATSGHKSNAFRYSDLLKEAAEGICLWYPSLEAALGDVGYIHEGTFVKLFNVFRPPDGLPGLLSPTGPPEVTVATLRNTHLAWMSLALSGCHMDAGVPVNTTFIQIGFEVQSQSGDAAFLVPRGESRRVETFYSVRDFELYLANNYAAIVERFSGHRNLETLMILRGTTHANGYCRGLLQQSHRGYSGVLTFSPLGPEIFSLDMGANRLVTGNWLIQESAPSTSNPDAQYCIIVNPIIVRRRAKLLRLLSTPFGIFTQDPSRSIPAAQYDFPSPPVRTPYS